MLPGNDEKCINDVDKGLNFTWNNWNLYNYITSVTFFLIGDHKTDKFNNVKIIKNKKWRANFYPYGEIYDYYVGNADMRLVKINDKILLYERGLKYILTVNVENDNEIVLDEYMTHINMGKGINQQIININSDESIFYLDWIYKRTGVAFVFHTTDVQQRNVYQFIKFENYILDGEGSYLTNKEDDIKMFGSNYGIMPKFSFSTPHIIINNHPNYGNAFLGVGHIKIYSDVAKYKYMKNSKIDLFRNNLYEDMKHKFGDKYIRHYGTSSPPYCEGYIYMMYFYIIYNDLKEMKLSNSYLPLYLNNKILDDEYDKDYKFSLIFPSGLEKLDNEKIIVTCGYGDFYAIILEFNINQVIDLCYHNIKNVSMSNYKYYIIAKDDKRIYTNERLNDILSNKTGGNYIKYVKDKSAYLKLKNNEQNKQLWKCAK